MTTFCQSPTSANCDGNANECRFEITCLNETFDQTYPWLPKSWANTALHRITSQEPVPRSLNFPSKLDCVSAECSAAVIRLFPQICSASQALRRQFPRATLTRVQVHNRHRARYDVFEVYHDIFSSSFISIVFSSSRGSTTIPILFITLTLSSTTLLMPGRKYRACWNCRIRKKGASILRNTSIRYIDYSSLSTILRVVVRPSLSATARRA